MTTYDVFKYEYRFCRYNYGPIESFFKALWKATRPVPF